MIKIQCSTSYNSMVVIKAFLDTSKGLSSEDRKVMNLRRRLIDI